MPKQSRIRPKATEKYTHQCQNNLVTDLRLTELVDKIQDTYKYRSTLLFTRHNNNKKYTKYTKVPKQSRNRPMVILQVYLAPKQSRNRPMITREYTHQCQNNLNRPKAYSTGGINKQNIYNIQEPNSNLSQQIFGF